MNINFHLNHPSGLYLFSEFEISLHQIKLLEAEQFTLSDFIDKTEKATQLSKKKKALSKKIDTILHLIKPDLICSSVEILGAANLSARNIALLKEHNITYLDIGNLTYNSFAEIIQSNSSNKETAFKRIKAAYEEIEDCINTFNSENGHIVTQRKYDTLITKLFNSLLPRQQLSLLDVKRYLIQQLQLSPKELDEDLIKEVLREKTKNNLISSDDLLFSKKYIKIIDFLFESNFIDKDIVIRKLDNATLQDIADVYGITRERIRQRLAKALKNLPIFEEVIFYKNTFEEYDWPEELFCLVFNEHHYTYRFLKLLFKKGTKNVLDHLEEFSFNSDKKNLILDHFSCYIDFENKIAPYHNKMRFFENLVYNLGEIAIQPEEFIEIANEFILSKELPEQLLFDKTNVNGLADRSTYVIRTNRNGFRFYDLNNLETHEINLLKKLLNLETGIYSTTKLFIENIELMNELNINSEYELHNIYKKIISVPNVEYTRMPEFSVGGITKNEFMILLFTELAPISVDNFVSYVEKEYGLRNNSLRALISNEYIQYLQNNMIVVHHTQATPEELTQLKNLLAKDIYTFDELSHIGMQMDANFRNKFLNNYTLLQVGYYIKGAFILNTKYSSIEQYFIEHILKQDTFYNTRTTVYQNSSFTSTLYELEQALDAIRIDRDLYITITKLNSSGISKEELYNYREAVFEFSGNMEYFTLPQIRELGFSHALEEYGFNDIFYERIVWSHPGLRSIHTASHIIFTKKSDEVNLTNFIRHIVSESKKIDFYSLFQKVQQQYDITLNTQRVIELIHNSTMHYSAEMERIYINKETFYKEIY